MEISLSGQYSSKLLTSGLFSQALCVLFNVDCILLSVLNYFYPNILNIWDFRFRYILGKNTNIHL